MKHKVKVQVPVEKRGLFGIKKTVMETRHHRGGRQEL